MKRNCQEANSVLKYFGIGSLCEYTPCLAGTRLYVSDNLLLHSYQVVIFILAYPCTFIACSLT